MLAAYLMLRPCAKVTTLVFRFVVKLDAYWVIGAWGLWQIWQLSTEAKDEVAYMAHVGGFFAGAALFPLMRPRGVALFQCLSPPEDSDTPADGDLAMTASAPARAIGMASP